MCEGFARAGVEVTVIHPHRKQPDPRLRDTSLFNYYSLNETFSVRTLPYLDTYVLQRWLPRLVFTIAHLAIDLLWTGYAAWTAKNMRADVYVSREPTVGWWLARFGLPSVYDAHGVPKRGQRWFVSQIARHRQLRLATSTNSWIRDRLLEMGFDSDRTEVLSNAMDPSQFVSIPSKEDCRKRLRLRLDRPIVGYIGRFEAMRLDKGVPILIESLGKLRREKRVEPLLLCVGGPMEPVGSYRELAERIGVPDENMIFVDRVPNVNVPYWIKSCDVVTVPWSWTEFSAYETSPIKLFEYMASKVPIVASDLPSIREILTDQDNAILVEPGNPDELAAGIERVLSDKSLSSRIASKAHQDVQLHTWERRAATMLTSASKVQ